MIGNRLKELEEYVIGCLLMDNSLFTHSIDVLSDKCFQEKDTKLMYMAIRNLFKDNKPFDIVTLNATLKGTVKPDYIASLATRVSFVMSDKYNNAIAYIKANEIKQDLIVASDKIKLELAEDEDPMIIAKNAINLLTDTISFNNKSKEKGTTELFSELTQKMEKAKITFESGQFAGIPCSINEYNKITGGAMPGELTIIAARPGMGKTAFIKSFINGCCAVNKPILVAELEMTTLQLTSRLASEILEVPATELLTGRHNNYAFNKMNEVVQNYYNNDKELLFIDDTPGLSLLELKARARRIMALHGLGMIIVDYLQLMKVDGMKGNREQEISAISRGLKELAKELNVPVIALSQLSRSVEQRGGDMMPKLSDLRESGSIEQDADIVGFIWRPEYYFLQGHSQFQTIKFNNEDISSKGFALLIIAKHRSGALKDIPMRFIDTLTKFTDYETNQFNYSKIKPNIDFSEPSTKRDDYEF